MKALYNVFIVALLVTPVLYGCGNKTVQALSSVPPETTPVSEDTSPPPLPGTVTGAFTYDFPENFRPLTDAEKSRLVEIALATPESQTQLEATSNYTTRIDWIALNPNTEGPGYGGFRLFEYDQVNQGIPRGTVTSRYENQNYSASGVPEDAKVVPCVIIWFGQKWIVYAAIDISDWQVIYSQTYPNLDDPDRFKGMQPPAG